MPQMAPMMWLFFMFFAVGLVMLLMVFIYFYNNKTTNKSFGMSLKPSGVKTWLW